MLKTEDILDKMKLHFPRWMDIRRKINSSIGGAYLSSVSDSIAEIQDAINDYKKDFFIDNYVGKEDDILTFLYKVPVGQVGNDSILSLIIPEYSITTDENLFYDNNDYAYYNDGYLYFKCPEEKIVYSIDNFKMEGTYEKIHVWNIFDEFAIILGLKRYQWETNQELLNRIFAFSKTRSNASENGLKEALIANLVNIAPNLSKDDIKIERPTANNLIKYYNQFETILDHLSKVNKETYKEKQWDIDTWNFSIKSIDYIPHAWDILLTEYVNGIGFNDDLKVEIIDEIPSTDVTIYFYKKKIDVLNDYIKKHNLKDTFKLSLSNYSEDIVSENVKYKITASDIEKINTNDISFKSIEEKVGYFNINMQDIVSDYDSSNLIAEDKSILSDDYNYSIDFIPTSNIGDFKINYLRQVSDDSYINLLNNNYPGFETIGEGVKSTISKKYIQDLYQLTSYNNIKKSVDGFEIVDLSKIGTMKIDISGLNGYNLNFENVSRETILDYNKFTLENCYIYNDEIISDTVEEDKLVSINLQANSFSCNIKGPYLIKYSIDNNETIEIKDENNLDYDFIIEGSNNPRNLNISIKFLDSNCKLKNTKYSKYDFNIYTENGNISNNMLPNFDVNTLTIDMRSYAGLSPLLKYIYIGNKLTDSNGYYNIQFNTDNGNKLLTKYENCRLQLKKYTKDTNELIETIYDYKPYVEYSALDDTTVELNLDNYIVNNIESEYGTIEIDTINNIKSIYKLTIPKDRSLSSVLISGKSYNPIVDQTLSSVLDRKGFAISKYKFYVSKNNDNILAKDNNSEELSFIKINKTDLFEETNTTTLHVDIGSNNIKSKFVESGIENYANKYTKDFDYISFEPSEGDIYIAINECNVFLPQTKNIEIVNTFNNNYDINSKKQRFFIIESLNEKYNVRFQTNEIFAYCSTKVIDNHKIVIKSIDEKLLQYNCSSTNVEVELNLGSSIELPKYIALNNEELVDIRQYVINSKYKINYKNKYNDNSNYLDYTFTETFSVSNSKISKLKFSNIKEIESISYQNNILKEDKDYICIFEAGLIIFLSDDILAGQLLTITYNINVPYSIEIDIEDLYEQIQYPVNSLELLSTEILTDAEANTSINLLLCNDYMDSDLVSIKFSKPGFMSNIQNDILTVTNNLPTNTIAIKTGYYYLNGREYYLLADEKYSNVDKIDSVNYHNIVKENNQLILKQKSDNYLVNTAFDLSVKGDIYNLNCFTKNNDSISLLNEVSTCDTFNYWNSFATKLSIVNGYNGQALKFESEKDLNGYCYISLDKLVDPNNDYTLSFYLKGDCTAYLAKEKSLDDNHEFNYQSILEVISSIDQSNIIDDIYDIDFSNKDKCKYYLLLVGSGIIDDIIISKKNEHDIYNHIKNLDLLNFNIAENIYSQYVSRLFITDRKGAIFSGTEINDENKIINSSYIQWGFTKIKALESYTDYSNCVLDNIDLLQYNNNCIVKTGSKAGSLTTQPIYVGNTKVINNLLIKINDVLFSNMKEMKIKLLTSNNSNSGFREVLTLADNIGMVSGIKLSSYIKLIVEIQPNKVINNIELFIEYLSTEKDAPIAMEVTNGVYTSKVLDSQYNERYFVKNINISDYDLTLGNYSFQIRGSKENNEETVWTPWKDVVIDETGNVTERVTFMDYRYFQFRVILKGENAGIKINHIELEVI